MLRVLRGAAILKGRSMIENVYALDAGAFEFLKQGFFPIYLLLDFKAAFPSLSRKFIFKALRAAGVSEDVIHAVRELYKDNKHFFTFRNLRKFALDAESGVKQGCPLSAAVFVIVTDAIVRYINCLLPKDIVFRAYCDDYAFVLKFPWRDLPILANIFITIGLATSLHLNLKKCKLIPTWEFNLNSVRNLIREHAPFWAKVDIVRSAEFLGFCVGPEAHKVVWRKPLFKFANRIDCIRRSGVGLNSSIILYNTCALPVLSHVAQLFKPSQCTVQYVANLSPKIISAPPAWASHSVLTRVKLLVPFQQDLLDFSTYCLAVRCRVIFRQFPQWVSFDAPGVICPQIKSDWFFNSPVISTRTFFNSLKKLGFLNQQGHFSNEEVNTSISSLDSKQTLQKNIYCAIFL
jgi:hypothetical protein